MAPELLVRAATADDETALLDLVRDAGLPLDGLHTVATRFVAERRGDLLGVAALEHHVDERGDAYLLRSVAVRPEARGQGVGAALTRAALRAVDEHGGTVALLTETAPGYFPRFAFVETARADLPTALAASTELQGACEVSARAFLRRPQP